MSYKFLRKGETAPSISQKIWIIDFFSLLGIYERTFKFTPGQSKIPTSIRQAPLNSHCLNSHVFCFRFVCLFQFISLGLIITRITRYYVKRLNTEEKKGSGGWGDSTHIHDILVSDRATFDTKCVSLQNIHTSPLLTTAQHNLTESLKWGPWPQEL